MRCPECKSDNLEGARFCSFCSAKMPQIVICPSCRAENVEGAKFCSSCAWRMDQDRPFATGSKPQAPPGRQAILDDLDDAVEGPETTTVSASTSFCHVCHEPIPTGDMYLDVDGNKLCRKCMMSGGKKKDPRERAIEELKAKMEGTATKVVHRGPAKPNQLKLKPEVEAAERRRGLLLPAIVVLLLLVAGGAAAAYFTGALAPILSRMGIELPGTSPTPKPEPEPEAKKGDSDKPVVPTKKQDEPLPPEPDSRVYLGVFKSVDGPDGRHPGSLVFESKTGELLFVILPPELASTASTYEPGKTYMIKFKPDAEYHNSRRVTLEMLEEPIKEFE